MKKVEKITLKIVIFPAVKNRYIVPGHVFEMETTNQTKELSILKLRRNDHNPPTLHTLVMQNGFTKTSPCNIQ